MTTPWGRDKSLRPAADPPRIGSAYLTRSPISASCFLSAVSQPSELTDNQFAQKIVLLSSADNGHYVVAEADQRIVGHGMLDPLPLAAVRHVVHLTLVVHDGWQGQGIGRALLGNLIEWARNAPAVEKIELNVRSSNARAQSLYRKMGFAEMGRWRRRVKVAPGQYLDDVVMELFVT